MRNEDLPEKLKYCREERAGLTQDELALKLHVDQAIISKVEKGKLIPSYVLVKEWARVTKSQDVFSMDFEGKDGWRKFVQMEAMVKQAKSLLESVQFMRRKIRKE